MSVIINASGGGTPATPGGADTDVQFNDGGTFGGDSGLTYDKTNNVLNINGALVTADAANILAQRNSTTAQTFRVYNTYTDASNYEVGVFDWNTTSNVLTIGTQAAGSGTWRAVTLSFNGPLKFNRSGNDIFSINGGSASFLIGSVWGWGWSSTGDPTLSPDTMLNRNAAGVVEINNGSAGTYRELILRSVKHNGVTIATLPGSPTIGQVASVTDGDAGLAWGATAVNTGAGATKYLVWYNGTNWTVVGK